MAETERLFFALWPAPGLAKALTDAAGLVARQRKIVGKPVPPERAHLTVLFLGEVAAPVAVALRAAVGRMRARPFDLVIDQVGCFYRSRVFWAGPSHVPSKLLELHEKLGAAARGVGLPRDDRALVPHLTCQRDIVDRIRPVPIAPIRWPVREFALVRSPEYHVVSHWPLQNARE